MRRANETVIDVEGMTCGACGRHVEVALRKLDGVGAVEVSLRDGKVRVEHDSTRATVEEMLEALVAAGYPGKEGSR